MRLAKLGVFRGISELTMCFFSRDTAEWLVRGWNGLRKGLQASVSKVKKE